MQPIHGKCQALTRINISTPLEVQQAWWLCHGILTLLDRNHAARQIHQMKKLLRSTIPVLVAFVLGIVVHRSLMPAPEATSNSGGISRQGPLSAQFADGTASSDEAKQAMRLASGSVGDIIAHLKKSNDYEESTCALWSTCLRKPARSVLPRWRQRFPSCLQGGIRC